MVAEGFFFERLNRNSYISLKCMVCNHFVVFSVCCCVIITSFTRYNAKKIYVGNLWWMKCLQPSCGVIQSVPKDFFADNDSMKSHL